MSAQRRGRLLVGDEHDGGRELGARPREDHVVEIGERDDQPHVVDGDEVAKGADVAEVVDPRHERAVVGVVERGRERVDVGRDRRRAGAAERRDDVDALAGAREERRRSRLVRVPRGREGAVSAVQPPVAPLYVPPKSASGVRRRISRSVFQSWCRTYQRSSSIRSAHGSDARPWICAQPVMPGFTSSRWSWRSS